MATIYVSGASDDCVEIDGDVSLEAYTPSSDELDVVVNDVRLLRVRYDTEGIWRVEVVGQVPGVAVQLVPSLGEDVPRVPVPPAFVVSYSDYAVVTGDVVSVVVGSQSWSA